MFITSNQIKFFAFTALIGSSFTCVAFVASIKQSYYLNKLNQLDKTEDSLKSLLSALKDAETGQRGYLLAGSQEYSDFLEPYERGSKMVPSVLRQLQVLLPKNTFNDLNKLSNKKLQELSESIRLIQSQKSNDARQLVLTRAGKETMDLIRSTIGANIFQIKRSRKSLSQKLSFFQKTIGISVSLLVFIVSVQGLLLISILVDFRRKLKNEAKKLKIENELLTIENDRYESLYDFLEKALQNFAHDVRSPLAGVSLMVQSLELNYEPRQLKYYHKLTETQILTKCQKITKLLNRIYTLCESVVALTQEPVFERINIKSLVKEVVEEFDDGSRILIFAATEGDEFIESDEQFITAILYNLLSNAVKFTSRGKTIRVEVSLSSTSSIDIRIADEGIGIPADEVGKIFERFIRATNSCNLPGTGLGLSIVAEAIKAINGSITVQSQVGVGTVFVVTLPRQSV